MMLLGVRVVRGPDWKWANQDKGEGQVGTVTEIDHKNKTASVQWDSGERNKYRVGAENGYDLRIFDSAPAGVRHASVTCDVCHTDGVQGTRWKCLQCHDYDLCSHCYMSDKHDKSHNFVRIDTPQATGTNVPARSSSKSEKVQSRGVFAGANVVRGPDWEWSNQDGGQGKVGKVTEIRAWDSKTGRNLADVLWSSGTRNNYRMGYKGKVDLKYVDYSSGGHYYRTHLPVLGQGIPSVHSIQFKKGDKVRCDLEAEVVEQMQKGHGGWNSEMANALGKVGVVKRVDSDGDVQVKVADKKWLFNPSCLTFIEHGIDDSDSSDDDDTMRDLVLRGLLSMLLTGRRGGQGSRAPSESHINFKVGDKVKCELEEDVVKQMQQGHGGWIPQMAEAIGQVAVVRRVDSDGDLRVSVGDREWAFNPCCMSLVTGEASSESRSNQTREATATTGNNNANQVQGATASSETGSSQEEIEQLRTRLRDLERTVHCPICLDRKRDLVFNCGHATCNVCAERITECPLCRTNITQKLNFFG